jgi:hypothetical protein
MNIRLNVIVFIAMLLLGCKTQLHAPITDEKFTPSNEQAIELLGAWSSNENIDGTSIRFEIKNYEHGVFTAEIKSGGRHESVKINSIHKDGVYVFSVPSSIFVGKEINSLGYVLYSGSVRSKVLSITPWEISSFRNLFAHSLEQVEIKPDLCIDENPKQCIKKEISFELLRFKDNNEVAKIIFDNFSEIFKTQDTVKFSKK